MDQIEFNRPQLEDGPLISSYFKKYPSRSCDRTFANVYLWARYYNVEFALTDNVIIFRNKGDDCCSFAYPVGAPEDVQKWIVKLLGTCEHAAENFRLYSVTKEQFEQLEQWFPGKFDITYNEDIADYVYETEKLTTLSGKKLHGKRNHINKFQATYENWAYETITEENYEECFQMALKWRQEHELEDDDEMVNEIAVTQNSLRLMKELNLTGGLLRVDGEIVAFTIGEPINDDTFVVHIEKAFAEIQGAYPMINQQFVTHECQDYKYINREEDTGAPGLRKAKQSYRPVFMVDKGTVTLKR